MTREKAKEILQNHSDEPLHFNIHITEAMDLVDKIYDNIESRTCENCRYYYKESFVNPIQIIIGCTLIRGIQNGLETKDFGCNKWEEKH